MLADDPRTSSEAADTEDLTVSIRMPDPARSGVVDVVSLRGIARAVSVLRGRIDPISLDAALSRMINANGALAKAIEDQRN